MHVCTHKQMEIPVKCNPSHDQTWVRGLWCAGYDAPAQQYRYIDVGAEELRGTFLSPARSEQRLLYSESPWCLSIYDHSYPNHFLVAPVCSPTVRPCSVSFGKLTCMLFAMAAHTMRSLQRGLLLHQLLQSHNS